ncbi:hypothetical protein ACFWIY_16205 [Streptomyces sioyaensis]|uniref:hypothetical protein n=1 Tax=Streptomyces sioyaensis TaxID=67364 RepID=UPI003653ED2C
MTRKTLPWFESLTDSVFALGASAREAQRAHQAAQVSTAHYDLDRLQFINGEISIPGRPSPVRPHDRALMAIGDSHDQHERRMAVLYGNAALGYAYGTAWAILRVLDGQEPPRVELKWLSDGCFVIPHELAPVPPEIKGLSRWVNNPKFEHARQRLMRCDQAGDYADHLSERAYLADHEASDMHDALDDAAGLPDAAYAYGVLAESALRFALLGARATHRQ